MKTILPLEVVTLGDSNSYHLFVRGSINGRQYDLLIDTGASHTIFDAALIPPAPLLFPPEQEIQTAGIQAGEVKTTFGLIGRFKLGDLICDNWTVILLDLAHVNSLYRNFSEKHVAGLIGSDFLLRHRATVCYRKRQLILRKIRQKEN
jgi:hypothetical protein